MLDLVIVRAIFVLVLGCCAYALNPIPGQPLLSVAGGVVLAAAIIFFEVRLEGVSLKRLIGAAIGSVLGILGAFLMSLVVGRALPGQPFLPVCLLLLMAYIGLVVGAKKGELLNLSALGGIFGVEKTSKKSFKILDTSVIIDGRIADVVDTQIIDGQMVIPKFVINELQGIADSSDRMRRSRGRRGLDILNRLRTSETVDVQIFDRELPEFAGQPVDLKLVTLAQHLSGKLITNDYNLNKVAQLQDVTVINLNDLANAMKPSFLPGEQITVRIVKAGEEHGQGIGYLDDGTMVVIENGREQIGQEVNIAVTSVIQKSAGRMVFGRFESSK